MINDHRTDLAFAELGFLQGVISGVYGSEAIHVHPAVYHDPPGVDEQRTLAGAHRAEALRE